MRQDWGRNEHGGGWRSRELERGERGGRGGMREADRGWYDEPFERQHGSGGGGRELFDREPWRAGNGGRGLSGREEERGGWQDRGWGGRGGGRLRSDDERRLEAGEAPIVKVIEVVAQSPHSWEDAARRAVAEASRTVHGIKSIYVKDMQAIVSDDRIVEFRLVAKISFAIHGGERDRQGGRRDYA